MIELPKNVLDAISLLEKSGFEAFVVGGAVRDSFLGKKSEDFDITTSALPEETKYVFKDFRVIETGIKHGTVTVLFDGAPLEITTYRVDGKYEDNRHPKSVSFTGNILDDLSRRDFTVNAIGYNPKHGIVDPFGGLEDLKNGIIRSVGNAEKRFNEDALRILRCVRFASVLGFSIEEETAGSVRSCVSLLENVSKERIFSEIKKLICGINAGNILEAFPEVIVKVIPELASSVGFCQKSKYHLYDVYTHTAKAIDASERDVLVRLALLYHDCGKPYVCTEDKDGFRHFLGHQEKSAAMAEASLLRLKCDSKTLNLVKKLVLYHDYKLVPQKKAVKRFLSHVTFEEARLILKVKFGDMASHAPQYVMTIEEQNQLSMLIDEIEREGDCISLKTLAVNGNDLFLLGIPKDKRMGEILNELLKSVISEELPNEKEALLLKAKELNV